MPSPLGSPGRTLNAKLKSPPALPLPDGYTLTLLVHSPSSGLPDLSVTKSGPFECTSRDSLSVPIGLASVQTAVCDALE